MALFHPLIGYISSKAFNFCLLNDFTKISRATLLAKHSGLITTKEIVIFLFFSFKGILSPGLMRLNGLSLNRDSNVCF